MRVYITIFLLIAIGICETKAQCNTTVHSGVISINTTLQVNGSLNKYWLCDGDTMLLTGNRNDIWVEDNAVFTINGDSNNIYARKNSVLTIAGVMNNVNYDVSITPNNNGSNTTLMGCNPMVFDYSMAPSTGCEHWVGLEDHILVRSASVYPSPANQFVNVAYHDQKGTDVMAGVYDSGARLVMSRSIAGATSPLMLDISALVPGIYTVQVTSGNVMSTTTFVVQR